MDRLSCAMVDVTKACNCHAVATNRLKAAPSHKPHVMDGNREIRTIDERHDLLLAIITLTSEIYEQAMDNTSFFNNSY